MLMSMLMSHASVDVFVLSFVLPCDVVLMLMSLVKTRLTSMLMPHASVDFFALSFVLSYAYAQVASENQTGLNTNNVYHRSLNIHSIKAITIGN